jgi:hypothetical protein
MSFVGDYDEYYTNEEWTQAAGKCYSDYIKHLINTHAPGGVYDDEYEDELRRGFFLYEGVMYTIRTWSIHERKNGCISAYSIFETNPQNATRMSKN